MNTITSKTTLVLGASLKPERYSNMAVKKLITNKVPTYAFGLRVGDINGVQIDTKLQDYNKLHTITLYLNPKRQVPFYDYIVSQRPQRIIFNPGTENPELMQILDKNEIAYEIACTLVLLNTKQY